MTITATLADIATRHPAATRVFARHGLDFCCGGGRPLVAACLAKGISADAVIREIQAEYAVPDQRRWDQAPLAELIAFITTHYHHRLREGLPDLVRWAARVEARHGAKPECPTGLAQLLARMQAGVLEHLDKEEGVLFPMILAGQGRHAAGPVHVMEVEHDEHGRNLQQVRALTADFTLPDTACATWSALYHGLQQLEQELMEHVHLENHVLFRRALME